MKNTYFKGIIFLLIHESINNTGIVDVKENGDVILQASSKEAFLSYCEIRKAERKEIDEEGALLLDSHLHLSGELKSLNEGITAEYSDKDWCWNAEKKVLSIPAKNKETFEKIKDQVSIFEMS